MPASGIIASIRGAVSRENYKYSALLPQHGPQQSAQQGRDQDQDTTYRPSQRRSTTLAKMALGGTALFSILLMAGSLGRAAPCAGDAAHIWGQYSPFFPVPSTIDASVPAGCNVTFAQVLSRHGARAPTQKKSTEYQATINRIKRTVTAYGAGYEFIKDYVYNLGHDDLTPLGEQEMVDSGEVFFRRYEALARGGSDPFVRASGSDRVVVSAQRFVEGFTDARGQNASAASDDILVIPEEAGFNNTLDHGGCPAFEDGPGSGVADRAQKTWLNIFGPPIMGRLNKMLPGANLSLTETIYMMDLCPFNTVATTPKAAATTTTVSDFCQLFSRDEWESYDYYQSLNKWYGYGKGNPLGPTQGVGFGNELIARLTGKPVDDHTSTNSTLDSSPVTFPLDRTLYADFSHDNTMTSIFAALGLHNATAQDLPPTYRLSPRQIHGYSAAWTVSFAARMYVERMWCGTDDDGDKEEEEELVRVLVNERVVPLQGCGADDLGRCKLGAFVDSLSFVRDGGLWDECFAG